MMPGWIRLVVTTVRRAVEHAILHPIRDGLLRSDGWPPGLMPLAVMALLGYALAAALAILAGPIRTVDVLLNSYETSTVLPLTAGTALTVLVVLSLSLLLTAALHAPWYAKIFATVLAATVMIPLGTGLTGYLGLVALGGLIVLFLIRHRGRFAWWEFPIVTACVWVGTELPWLMLDSASAFGVRGLPTVLVGILSSQLLVTVPVFMAAGASMAQVTTLVVDSVSRELGSGLSRRGWTAVLVVLVALVGLQVAVSVRDSTGWLEPHALVGSVGLWLLSGGLVALILRLAGRPPMPDPERLAEDFGGVFIPLGAVLILLPVMLAPGAQLHALAESFRLQELAAATGWLQTLASSPVGLAVARAVTGLVLVGVAITLARRGRAAVAVPLGALAALTWLNLTTLLVGWETLDLTGPLALTAAGWAVLASAWQLIRGRFDAYAAWGLGLILLMANVFPHRGVISDPLSALMGFSGVGVLLFGLIWRVLTDGSFANTDTPAFPRPVRVLSFLGYLLFAMCAVAFVALTRTSGGELDVTPFGTNGDAYLGTPLLVATVLYGLTLIVRGGNISPAQPVATPAQTPVR